MPVKPMRACSATDEQIEALIKKFGYMIASPKLDGIRCSIQNEIALTKSLKKIPNNYIRSKLQDAWLHGCDGELIVGPPNVYNTYSTTYSGVMSIKKEPDFKFYIFDHCISDSPYRMRRPVLKWSNPYVIIHEHLVITNLADMLSYEESCLNQGYEGLVLRDPLGKYKHGKCTVKEGGSVKVKRFTDAEVKITGMIEQMHNANEATTNELGHTQRSNHKKNLVPMGTMGTLIGVDVVTGVEVKMGTGFSKALRQEMWDNRNNSNTVYGTLAKYKSFKIGVKDKPRHSVYLGPRSLLDI